MREFLRDNFGRIISIIMVILIVGGIYYYAKRTRVGKFENEPNCENYRHQPVQYIPAGCLNYFQTNDTRRITR